ncbi:MAG: hypothetical protein ABI895_33355 [Deltaproteobacteria bacterium]
MSATLDAGLYSAHLEAGWALERQDPAQVVEASLMSPNPTSFEILAGSTTRLVYEFEAGGGAVSIGSGTVVFSIDVIAPDAGTGASGSSRDTCTLYPGDISCGSAAVCGTLAGDDGVPFHQCIPTCNPVTQERDNDHAPACGSPDPAVPTLGCYGPPAGPFTCAQAGAAAKTHRVPAASASGAVFLNACAPGYMPWLPSATGDSTRLCIAVCAPATTSQGSAANANGVPPHACRDRGANQAECIFSWILGADQETAPAGSLLNAVGLCYDSSFYTYDDDGNASTPEVTTPSCATLASTDTDSDGVPEYLEFGCGPQPDL